MNHIDTAAFYFDAHHSANELINSSLRPYPGDLTIVTKVGPARDDTGAWLPEARPDALRGQVERNLRELGTDQLDLVLLRIGEMSKGAGPLAERFGVLAELREQGMIRELGISNVRQEHLTEAQGIAPVRCVQNRYGLGNREDDPLLDECARQGVAFTPFFAIADASDSEVLRTVARRLDSTPAQVALAWTLHRGRNVLAIPGTADPVHLEQNIAAGGLKFGERDLAELESLGNADTDTTTTRQFLET